MLSLDDPPELTASQVYLPWSFVVTLVRQIALLCPLRVPSFVHRIWGSGKPASTIQVKLTLSPSLMVLFGIITWIFGKAKKRKEITKTECSTKLFDFLFTTANHFHPCILSLLNLYHVTNWSSQVNSIRNLCKVKLVQNPCLPPIGWAQVTNVGNNSVFDLLLR